MAELVMTIHPENLKVLVDSIQDAFNVYAQADPESTGFGIVRDGSLIYLQKETERGYISWVYLNGKCIQERKVWFDEVKTITLTSSKL